MQLAVDAPSTHDCYLNDGVTGVGPFPADIMLIGIAPGRDEWTRTKKPFTGPSGKELDNFLKFIGLRRDQVYLSNVLCWWNDKPTPEEIRRCLPRLMAEIGAVQPKMIITLGDIVSTFFLADQLQREYEMEEPPKFGTMRSGVYYANIGDWTGWVMPTYHPAAYLYRAGKAAGFTVDIADAVRDFRKIQEVINWPADYAHVDIEVAQGGRQANQVLEHMCRHKNEVVAVDVETKYDGTGFLTIAFACEHMTVHFPTEVLDSVDWDIWRDNVDGVRWTFHNGQFDSIQIRKYLAVDVPIVEDTMLMSYSLDERGGQDLENDAGGKQRSVGIHGLKRLAREYCGAGFYDAKAKGRIDQLEPDEIADYNGKDAAYTYRLATRFMAAQIDDDVREMYLELLIPTANTLAAITERGVQIDKKALAELAREWIPEWMDAEEKLQNEAIKFGWTGIMPNKKGVMVNRGEKINLGSPQQLQYFIYDICKVKEVRGEGRTTKMDVLKQFAADLTNPIGVWCNELLAWRGLDHDINNYIMSIDELMDENDCIHPEAMMHGTRVGRFAYHDPPVQTIPKQRTVGANRARIRRIFRARKGYVFLEADYSQAEMYAAVMNSGDDAIFTDLKSGDFHAANVERGFHTTREELREKRGYVDGEAEFDRLRDSTKIFTYAKFYGGGIGAVTGENRVGRGSGGNYAFMDHKTAVEFDKYWEGRYHKYISWRNNEKHIVITEGEQVSLTGRKRRYFRVNNYQQLNQAINFPNSSLSHDHLIVSMNQLFHALAEFDSYVLFDVHDALLFEVKKEYLEEVARIIKRIMERPKFGMPFGIPVDMKVGPNWFDMEKYKVAA